MLKCVESTLGATESTLQIITEAQEEARGYLSTLDRECDGGLQAVSSGAWQQLMEFQGKKRLANIQIIISRAAELLSEKHVPNTDPDFDWTARFFDHAQDISTEELRELWARILAGEVECPGSTSLRTLSILKDLSHHEAQHFFQLMQFRIDNFIFITGFEAVADAQLITALVHLSDVGLFHSGLGASPVLTLPESGVYRIPHHDHVLFVEGSPGGNIDVSLQAMLLTSTGIELAQFCHHKPNAAYLAHFARCLAEQHYTLKSARIVSTGVQVGSQVATSEPHVVKPALEGAGTDRP